MNTFSRLTVMVAIMALGLLGQDHRSDGEPVRGEISSSAPILGSITVELAPMMGGGASVTAVVSPDGSFELRSIRPGVYTLRVADGYGACIHQETVNIGGLGQRLVIRLEGRPKANRSASNTVSVRELTHKIPPQAQKAVAKGRDAAGKGKMEEAENLFRQAVGTDPEYVDAYMELGCVQAARGELAEATVQFQKVIDLEPEHREALTNLSVALGKLRKFGEAAFVARRTLRLYPDAGKVHFVLAASLIAEHGDIDEALDHLKRASDEVPKADLIAADLLSSQGRNQDASRHLEKYLATLPAKSADRRAVEERLASLQR